MALRHLRGPGVADSHGWSAAQNLVIFSNKILRLKMALMRNKYDGPFGPFENMPGRIIRLESFRINVGGLDNRDHTHYTNDLLKSFLRVLNFDRVEAFYQDLMDGECK